MMVMLQRKRYAAFIIIVCICVFFLFFRFFCDDSVVQIGEEKITEKDIEYQRGIEKCYSEQGISREIALIQLKNKFLEKEVLRMAFGVEAPQDALEEKAEWVDENTKAHVILDCVKDVFGDDRRSYLRLYIQPTVVNPKLHTIFSRSQEIHKDEIKRIMEIQDEIKRGREPESFPEYRVFEVYKEIETHEILNMKGIEFQENPLVEKVLKNLDPGEIWPDIVEEDYFYRILRFLEEDDEKYYCDGIIVEKKNFDQWFSDYAEKNIFYK